MAHQPDRESRLLNADFVIDNSATIDALSPQLELAWRWLEALPDGRLVKRG